MSQYCHKGALGHINIHTVNGPVRPYDIAFLIAFVIFIYEIFGMYHFHRFIRPPFYLMHIGCSIRLTAVHCILFYGMRQYFSTPDIMTPDASGKLREQKYPPILLLS